MDRRAYGWGAAAAIVTFVVFMPTLRYGFVFDDQILIGNNVNLTFARLGRLVTSPLWAIAEDGVPAVYRHLGHFFRPVISLSYLVDKTLYGGGPWGFHLTNCLMHALNVLLAFGLLRYFFPVAWQAALLALLFGVHPNNSEVVAAIHGRTDLFASVFTLAALLVYLKQPAARLRPLTVAGFSLCFALALGSKEQSLLIVPLLAGLHFLPELRDRELSWANRRAYFACAALVTLGYFLLRRQALEGLPDLPWSLSPEVALLGVGHVFKLLTATLFPWGSYALKSELSFTPHLVTLEVFSCGVVLALAYRQRPRLVVLGGLWFASTVLLSVLGVAAVYDGELGRLSRRYAHVGTPAVLWIVGVWLFREWGRRSELWATRAIGGLAALAFATQTAARDEVYRDSLSFWQTRIRELPNHEVGYYNLGRELMRLEDHAAAAEAFAKAVAINPMFMEGYGQVNLITCLRRLGDSKGATAIVNEALQRFPHNSDLVRQAAELANETRNSDPELERWYDAATKAQSEQRFSESLGYLEKIHERRQNYRISRFLAGFARQQVKDLGRATLEYELAARHSPDYPLTYVNLGYAFLERREPRSACDNFERAEQLLPGNQNVAWGLGECRRLLAAGP